jgi:hypothetical protein
MKTIRLLTIGNSFADNALTHLEALAANSGTVRLEAGRANIGGCSLEKHWNLADYTSAHPEYKSYANAPLPGNTRGPATLQEALGAADWDYVTLQQVSTHSWRRESFEPFLSRLHGLVRERAPRAEVLLHQTWAYRSDAPFLPESGLTQERMFAGIRDAYRHYGEALRCRILPAGEAVQLARAAAARTFVWPDADFDYALAQAPALPRQAHSLEAGWYWQIAGTPDGRPVLRLDPKHLNAAGCFLVSAVWFECLTGLDVRSIPFAPPEMDAATASFLRDVAHQTVASHRSEWPPSVAPQR